MDSSTVPDSSPADSRVDAPADLGEDVTPSCVTTPYEPAKPLPSGGFVCGVGECRLVAQGACKMTVVPAGGEPSPCPALYPTEKLGNGKDDDCDGVVDEGHPVEASPAGFECKSCAFGRKVRRKADGTLDTITPGNFYGDYENNPGCVNSELCKLPKEQWVRHAGFKGTKTCSDFCAALGRTCQPLCATTGCKAEANKTGLGTYAADYSCMGGGVRPLVGACDAVLTDVVPSNAFNVFCCCAM